MGSFFANLSILSKRPIAELVAEAMTELGYRPSENGEPLYLLPRNGKWQTLHLDMCNPVAEPLHDALADRCEAMLAICCADSDYMTIELTRGSAVETVCINEPYDPIEEIVSIPSPGHWQPVVSDLDAFQRILDTNYVFAEESLIDMAPLFGFDASQLNRIPEDLEDDPPEDMIELSYENSSPSAIDRMRQAFLDGSAKFDPATGFIPEEFHQTLNKLTGLFFDSGEE